jgi:hypothetical protein
MTTTRSPSREEATLTFDRAKRQALSSRLPSISSTSSRCTRASCDGVHVDRNGRATIGVQPQERSRQALGRVLDRAVRTKRRPEAAATRLRKVIVHLTAHALRPADRSTQAEPPGQRDRARDASCVSTASGVFKSMCQVAGLASARCTAPLHDAPSSAFRSSTSGCTSGG